MSGVELLDVKYIKVIDVVTDNDGLEEDGDYLLGYPYGRF